MNVAMELAAEYLQFVAFAVSVYDTLSCCITLRLAAKTDCFMAMN